MEKSHREIIWLFLKVLVALICITNNEGSFAAEIAGNQDVSDIQNGNHLDLNERMSNLEAENRQQKQEMAVMKTTIDENRKEMENINGRVSMLEKSETAESQKSDDIDVLSRPKRPFRLIPAKFPNEKVKETDTGKEKVYGPPTSCDDLNKIGYTLNGYYLIKGKGKLNANRIQSVYCEFHQPPGTDKKSFETWIGNVEVKTKSVHFYVQRSTQYPSGSQPGPIAFNIEQLNVGGAMNLTTGEFTAPVDGIYHFEFRCLKYPVPEELIIYLVVKEKITKVVHSATIAGRPIVASTLMSRVSNHSTGSLTASLKLKTSDVVNLISKASRRFLYDGLPHYTQFAGWLVEEDLALA